MGSISGGSQISPFDIFILSSLSRYTYFRYLCFHSTPSTEVLNYQHVVMVSSNDPGWPLPAVYANYCIAVILSYLQVGIITGIW